ncbi:hypothetical protein PF003_g7750 [Phytophthora fragariae]|nr:hypothetical protein PF003_g7750 [Phytophthora fragariae]
MSLQKRLCRALAHVNALQRRDQPHHAPPRTPMGTRGNLHERGLYCSGMRSTSAGQTSGSHSSLAEPSAVSVTSSKPGELRIDDAVDGDFTRGRLSITAKASESYPSDSKASVNHTGMSRSRKRRWLTRRSARGGGQ